MEDLEKEFKRLDLKDYKIPEKKAGRNLNRIQRLTLEIIKEFEISKEFRERWFRVVKKYPAFIEDNFLRIKKYTNVRNKAAYLWGIIHKKK